MTQQEKDMLDVYERFGDKAQEAVDFVRRNTVIGEVAQKEMTRPDDVTSKLLPNGVYIVYQSGEYQLFGDSCRKDAGMRVGISWDGHTWIVGTDYGDLPWSEADDDKLKTNNARIMTEAEAVLDWDVAGAWKDLHELWCHIPFKRDEMMPTCPMVIVQEYVAKKGVLNEALKFCGQKEYEIDVTRWFAQRYNANDARVFNGSYGNLNDNYVGSRIRCQAVALWKYE